MTWFEGLEERALCSVAGQDPSLAAWFIADSINSSNGATVALWADSTGDGFNATQGTASRRPTYIANAIGLHSAVRFSSAASTQLAFSRPVSGDFTLMVVFKSNQDIGKGQTWFSGAGLVDGEVGGVKNDFGLSLNSAGQVMGGTGMPDVTAVSGVGFNDGRPHVASFTRSAATGAITTYVDGKLFAQATGGTQALSSSSRLTIGSLQSNINYFTGDIADVRVYSTALPAATRAAVEAGLAETYGIAAPAARTFTNPVVNANFPDPGVIKVGSTYYAFATNSGGKTVPERSSTDLVHWSQPVEALPTLPSWAKSGRTWAPYVAKMADGIHYDMYYTAWSKSDGRQHVGVAQSTSPAGPFTPVGAAPLVDQASLGGAIDPSVFVESNGARYLLWKNDGNAIGQITTVYVQQLSSDGLSLIGSATPLIHNDQAWEGSVIEAPEMLKHDNRYYLFYSASNYASAAYSIGYASSSSLTGPFSKPAGPWVASVGDVVGPGGESFTVGPDGNTWMLYHSWENSFAYRSMSVDEVNWNGDVPILRGPSRVEQPVPTFVRPAPHLTAARSDASISYASGVVSGSANARLTLQFFNASAAGATPEFVGSAIVTTDASGSARFLNVPLAWAAPGGSLTVTATDAGGEGSPASTPMVVHRTGDVNGDGNVDFDDLVLVAQHYNGAAIAGEGDIDGDGEADFNDLVLLAQNYNTVAPAPAPVQRVAAGDSARELLQSSSSSDVLVTVSKRNAPRPVQRARRL